MCNRVIELRIQTHVEEFIERIYNPVRLHSALGYQSPVEFERQQASDKAQRAWRPASMSFRRHEEIYSDGLKSQIAGGAAALPGHSSE